MAFSAIARGTASGAEVAALIRREATSLDPEIFMTDVGTMDDHLGYIFFLPRLAASILSLVGALAATLACIGLYGLVSYGVSRRTREMGIRLALGADRRAVVRLVLRNGMALVIVGAVVGVALSLAVGGAAERFLLGVTGLDPASLIGAPLLLVAVALTATYRPARRAARVDPVRALRTE